MQRHRKTIGKSLAAADGFAKSGAKFYGGPGATHGFNGWEGRSTLLNFFIFKQGRAIHGFGEIGQDGAVKPEIFHYCVQQPVVGRADKTRQQVNVFLFRCTLFGQLQDHFADSGVEAFHVRAGIAGRGDIYKAG